MSLAIRSALCGIFICTALSGETAAKSEWVLTFSDEFDGPELDFTKWAPHSAAGNVASAVMPGAIEVRNGHALITARREGGRYTSGAMSTYGTFAQTYGRFEISVRAPQGRGLESRCRLLPVPSGSLPAIEIFRLPGTESDRMQFGDRWGTETTERSYSGTWNMSPAAAGNRFHVIAVEWDAAKIVWFVDGKERFRSVDGIPHQPMYPEIDLNIGGGEAKWPDETTPFPATLEVDYVRVYKAGR